MDGVKRVLLHSAREFAVAQRVLNWLPKNKPANKYDAERWEAEYRSGGWNFLGGLNQGARHAVVAEWWERLKPGGTVLEVGCGAGHLCRLMRRVGFERYLGIDISPTAVASAEAELGDARTRFVVGDAVSFVTDERFDVIILDGVLDYYSTDPRSFMRAMHRNLRTDGVLIVSLSQSGLHDGLAKLRIWRAIEPDHHTIEDVTLCRTPWPITIVKALLPISGRLNPPSQASLQS